MRKIHMLTNTWKHGILGPFDVPNVTFENVVRYGRPVSRNAANVEIGDHTKDIVFK